MTPVSDKLDQFFTDKMKEYPTRRSFLVPMLLYSQDEVGYLSDEVIAYLAKKTELTKQDLLRRALDALLITHKLLKPAKSA